MILRGLAAFLGVFTLINLIGSLFGTHADLNNWWIDFRPLPLVASRIILLATAICLILVAANAVSRRSVRLISVALLDATAFVALVNAVTFYYLLATGRIGSALWLPLSVVVCTFLAALGWRTLRGTARQSRLSIGRMSAVVCCAALAFPLAQMLFLGTTDYRRHADMIVVLGARAYADGTPSQALADRVRTACELYQQGWADKLVFSGGPGDGAISEPQAMRQFAMGLGVPSNSILLDEKGINTDATVNNTVAMFKGADVRNVLVVSHAYHLPRIKMDCQRAGWNVFTVPAKETRYLRREPILICREVAAFWFYYLRQAC